jgi:hypothetical protein
MPTLITLTEDGHLGKAGDQVWVDDETVSQTVSKPAKKTAAKKK